jgi:hypothetical protein
MRYKLYRANGALNSGPVFDAFDQGIQSIKEYSVAANEDVAVIWSVLWNGRMQGNQSIFYAFQTQKKPVIIIEVGNLIRNNTWRISLDNINSLGYFANDIDLDSNRPKHLGIKLKDTNPNRRPEILIAAQHQNSLQWKGMPPMVDWVKQTIEKIKQHTDRNIVVRPHPRSPFKLDIPGVRVEVPQKLRDTYDDFDIDYNYHCVVNHNSGPAVQAAIQGVPVICDSSSLAGELSGTFENIENIQLPDRTDWIIKLAHTEWTVDEIAQGIPLKRLKPKLNQLIANSLLS